MAQPWLQIDGTHEAERSKRPAGESDELSRKVEAGAAGLKDGARS